MTWEDYQHECSWCGCQQLTKEVEGFTKTLSLCSQCLARYHQDCRFGYIWNAPEKEQNQ